MQQEILIREFEPDDAACVQFVVLSVLQEWGFLPTAKDHQELEALNSQNLFDAFYVAEDPTLGVVGCAGIVRVDGETCELRKIYLLQRFRRFGIGRRLLEACTKAAMRNRYNRMRLEVNFGMTHFAPFYLNNGFVEAVDEKPVHNPLAEQVFYRPLLHLEPQ